jgi:hypothetical protein
MRMPCSWWLSARPRPALLSVCLVAICALAVYGFVARAADAEQQARFARLGLAASRRMQAVSAPPCEVVASCIIIHVFLYRRPEPAGRLLAQLTAANYSAYDKPLPLVLHVDAVPANSSISLSAEVEDVRALARGFAWPHGPITLDVQSDARGNRGLKGSWLAAWPEPRPNDLMIAFEDDMVVSPQYFQWLLAVLRTYRLQEPGRDPSLLGISLSPVRLDEISTPCTHPFRHWMTHENIPAQFPIYLHALPSSWGAAYFGDKWAAFLSFMRVRHAPPFYHADPSAEAAAAQAVSGAPLDVASLALPNSCSNMWPRSWKRFMIDFAYGRGAYMLYPNINGSAGLATTLQLAGEHTKGLANNPRIAPLVTRMEQWTHAAPWPAYHSLPIVDLRGYNASGVGLGRTGDAFVAGVCGVGASEKATAALVAAWARPCLAGNAAAATCGAPAPATRYLVFLPRVGLADQCIAAVNAAVWAHTLRRVLVLPPVIAPSTVKGVAAAPIELAHFPAVLGSAGLTAALPGLQYVHADIRAMREWSPSRVLIVAAPTAEPEGGTDVADQYLDALGWGSLPRVDLLAHADGLSTADGVHARLGGCADEVLVVSGLDSRRRGLRMAPPATALSALATAC